MKKGHPGAEAFYERYGFAPMELIEGQSAARPMPTPMFLAITAIQAAVSKK